MFPGVFGMVDADADRKERKHHEQPAEVNHQSSSPRFRDETFARKLSQSFRENEDFHRYYEFPSTSVEEAPEVTPPPAKARTIRHTAGEAPLTSAVEMPVVEGYPATLKLDAKELTALPAKTAPPPAETPTEEAPKPAAITLGTWA